MPHAALPDAEKRGGWRREVALCEARHPRRSGDIYVVFEPHRFINDFDGLVVASTHGSPWSYDTHVPVIFVVPGVPAATALRRVSPLDVAPTLSALVGAKPPSGAEGDPLPEVFG